jgi:hypothetical protein
MEQKSTVSTSKTRAIVKKLMAEATTGDVYSDITLTQCDNGSICWGDQNRACCQQDEGVFVLNGEQVAFDPSATSSISTSTPTGSTISSAPAATSASATESSSSDGGLSTGAQAGIGVGAGLAGLALVLLIVWLVWRRRKNKQPRQIAELSEQHQPVMLDTSSPRSELPSPPSQSRFDGSTQFSGSSEGLNKPKQNRPYEMSA